MPEPGNHDERGFHTGERTLQERFDSVRLADRVADFTHHDIISDADRAFMEARDMFFLATSDPDGNLDCSYKGGEPGFVRVVDERTLVFPSYDGNGKFQSTGNILIRGKVAMLFVDFDGQSRMRVNGSATIDFDDPLLPDFPEAQFLVRVTTEQIFANCPRYIHKMALVERSVFVPKAGCETPDPEWKDHLEAELPAAQRDRRAARRGPGIGGR